MANTVNITNRYNNMDKRYAEAVVVSLPSQLEEGGVRLSTPPVQAQFGDALVAAVIEPDTIIKKAYLIVDEAFPAGALLAVDVAGIAYFAGADLTVTGLVVSTVEDEYFKVGQTVTSAITGGTGDIVGGSARIVLDTDSPTLKNGNYAAWH